MTDYYHRPRAVVVGAGHNGLTAAIVLARAGWEVDVYERSRNPGGAATSGEVFGTGTIVDFGAAAHPLGVASPIFKELRLEEHGLRWAHSMYPLAHPLDNVPAVLLHRSLADTAAGLGVDASAWRRLHGHIVSHIDAHLENFLAPLLRVPPHPLHMAKFGIPAFAPANLLGKVLFRDEPARALLTGNAIHAIVPPSQALTAAFGTLFAALGMSRGWPVAVGGTQAIIDALVSVAREYGVRIHLTCEVTHLHELPVHDAAILNLTPRQILNLPGVDLGRGVRSRFSRWRYGMGIFKVDYLLTQPVPWKDSRVCAATTVHVGGTASEIDHAEKQVQAGKLPDKPFIMVCQQQIADPTRTQTGHVLWTYTHVPHGYEETHPDEVTSLIESQIERFAPGFREMIVDKHSTSPMQLEAWNPNLIGGDIAGGAMAGAGALLRPGLTTQPYRVGAKTFLASGATPPGAGVHGMPGAHAAYAAIFARRQHG